MISPIEHFSAITTAVIKDLQERGILRLMTNATSPDPLDIDSPEAKDLIQKITTAIYEGAVEPMNPHIAPDIK